MKLQASRPFTLGFAGMVLVAAGLIAWLSLPRPTWSDSEITTLRSLWIGNLPDLSPDPTNRYADDLHAASLGYRLFFDMRFSANGEVSCATCHDPAKQFQDGLPLAQGVGTTARRSMSIVGTAYSPWLFWDGRKDSLWAQALGPLENAVEHGGNRTQYVRLVAAFYKDDYEALFGTLPDFSLLPLNAGPVADPNANAAWEAMSQADRQAVTRVYANIGKAIAAYERLIMPGASRFDEYVEAAIANDTQQMNALYTPDEAAGLRLFIGSANCLQCHNGPLFTDNHFHNTGVPVVEGLPEDTGRAQGAAEVQNDEFNCMSTYSDAKPDDCAELRYMVAGGEDLIRAFKPPSLRNVAERAPYMNAGQFETLVDVVEHYNSAPTSPAGHSEIKPISLNETETAQLIAFLKTLSGPLATSQEWLAVPSGMGN
jgi:cytochrome c peroxidase